MDSRCIGTNCGLWIATGLGLLCQEKQSAYPGSRKLSHRLFHLLVDQLGIEPPLAYIHITTGIGRVRKPRAEFTGNDMTGCVVRGDDQLSLGAVHKLMTARRIIGSIAHTILVRHIEPIGAHTSN